MIAAFISTLAHSRNQTLKLVADLNDDQMVVQPAPGMNHPAWVLGHLLGVEYNFLKTLGVDGPVADAAWNEIYGGNSQPVSDKSRYQPKSFYLERLCATRARIIARLKEITPAQLEAPHPDPARRERFPTVADAILLYGTWHEAYHAGQLSAWRRVQGMPPV